MVSVQESRFWIRNHETFHGHLLALSHCAETNLANAYKTECQSAQGCH